MAKPLVTIWWSSVSLLSFVIPVKCIDYELIRFETAVKPDKIWDSSKVRINRIGHGVYVFSGSIELLQDLGEDSKFTAKAFYSTTGKDKYTLLPHHLNPGSGCEFLNNDYKKYLGDLPQASDFPEVGDKYYCPLKKGVYNLRNFKWDPTALAPIFKPGYYKIQFNFAVANGDKSEFDFYLKVISLSSK